METATAAGGVLGRAGIVPTALRVVAPIGRSQTYRNLLYLLMSAPLGVAYFLVLVVGLGAGALLTFVLVGVPLLLSTLWLWRAMAVFERMCARGLLRVPIVAPAKIPAEGTSVWERALIRLRDPVTWKALVFVVAKCPAGVVTWIVLAIASFHAVVLTLAPIVVSWVPIIFLGTEIEKPSQALPLFPIGLVAIVVTLHLVNGLAWLHGLFARLLLGPSSAELEQRLATLRSARARIIEATDAERRRIERNLHDGAQQSLVALTLKLGMAKARLPEDPKTAATLVDEAHTEATQAVEELRELARGIHPTVVSERGLGPALEGLATRAPLPVEVSGVPEERLPGSVEVAVYYVVAEALTNVAKYARASEVSVRLARAEGVLRVEVRDDGVGGADPAGGSGLRGLADRIESLDGQIGLDSPPGSGTLLRAELPLEAR
jgi:signal transduction histidine kinase